ncbi:hypothetical protein FB451DRAFT_1405868 [Mycena latifolia]|nr:hypothetical protein FB451DRAFT_1405868 [Mycena latifolia]
MQYFQVDIFAVMFGIAAAVYLSADATRLAHDFDARTEGFDEQTRNYRPVEPAAGKREQERHGPGPNRTDASCLHVDDNVQVMYAGAHHAPPGLISLLASLSLCDIFKWIISRLC